METGLVEDIIPSSSHTDASDNVVIGQPFDSSEHRDISEITLDGKLQKSRERNREHARKTRLRKKAHLESLKQKLSELQSEAATLSMRMEESNTASILLCLGSNQQTPDKEEPTSSSSTSMTGPPEIWKGNLVEHIRNMVRSEANQGRHLGREGSNMTGLSSKNSSDNGESKNSDLTDKEKIDSNSSDFGSDNDDADEFDPEMENSIKLLKSEDDEGKIIDVDSLRKERNRMHAKLTRDRKKLFTSRVQQMIKSLERQNTFMRNRLLNMEQSVGTSFLDNA